MTTQDSSDRLFEAQRAVGALLCQCAGVIVRDPLFVLQCARCAKRIHRRHDGDIPPTTTARREPSTASK